MASNYFPTFREFKKQKDKALFFDFEEIKAKKVKQQFDKKGIENYPQNHFIYLFKNVKGDSSYTQKQVVIKNISNLNKNGFKNALNYCIKHSEKFTCYDSENNELTTPDVFKKWEKDFGTNTNSKDVWHLVFSIKEQDSFVSRSYLIQSAIETIKKNFPFNDFVFVPHWHQNNPHIHILLNKRNQITDRKIHFKDREEIRNFFNNLRNDFATSLNQRGYNYKNTMKLENDLEQNLKDLEKINLNSKIALLNVLESQHTSLKKKIDNLENKRLNLRKLIWDLRVEKKNLIVEALKNQMNKNKIYFQQFKEVKKLNEKLKFFYSNYKDIDEEISKLKRDRNLTDNYMELDKSFSNDWASIFEKEKYLEFLKKNFKRKHLPKKQQTLLNLFEKEIILQKQTANDFTLDYIKTNLKHSKIFGEKANAFKLLEMKKILLKCSIMAIRGEVHISYLDKINRNISFMDKTLEKKYQFLEKYLKNKQEISLFNFKEFSTLSKALEKNNIEFLKELEQKIKNKSPQQIKEKKQIISSSKNKEALNIKENLSHSPYN
ncbi:hypothetical protein LS72_005150 [Helicobacter apodemus]|uniref:MobA/VirD2-like nuclease domain-containing protein n=1 Tax=Helicobacter apodemus TaxID=135569 RepID=A0A4U8UEP3_9HELI|nr:hypothetical protein [Helicobacter apodemus]TLE15947.1 hypothetical protein LS72_005150 [Helicobacter apodemus]